MGIGFSINGAEHQRLECWAAPAALSILLAQLAPFQMHTLKKSSLDQGMCDTCTQSKYIGIFSTHLPIPAPGGRSGVSLTAVAGLQSSGLT